MPSSSSGDSNPGSVLRADTCGSLRITAQSFDISQAQSRSDYTAARILFREYAEKLGVELCFQGFSSELQTLDRMYAPPSGCLILAWCEDVPVGCVGVRKLSATHCEMKRLYVRDSMRGRGCGRRLAIEILQRARTLGYECMVLDTLEPMVEARRLYASLGFRECAPYYPNPLPGVRYLELNL